MTQSSCTQPCLVFARYSELCILASPCKLRSAGSLQYFTLRKKDQRALWYNTAFTQLPLATRYVYKKGIFFSYSFSLTGRVEFSVHIAGRQKAHPREILDSSEKNPLFAKLQCKKYKFILKSQFIIKSFIQLSYPKMILHFISRCLYYNSYL